MQSRKERSDDERRQMQGNGVGGSFEFLEPFWPDLHKSGRDAEKAGTEAPDMAAVRLRRFSEAMVVHLYGHLGVALDRTKKLIERLDELGDMGVLEEPVLSKLHTIRIVGNRGAHDGNVKPAQVEGLIQDALSLAHWFCRLVRPDVDWGAAAPPHAALEKAEPDEPARALSPALDAADDRKARIRDLAATAWSAIAPGLRTPRTGLTLRDGFALAPTVDQAGCLAALDAFLSTPSPRVFLLKGYAGTGKTFMINGVVDYLLAQGRAFRLAAPTGRAAKLLSDRSGRAASTLHRMIYGKGELQTYGEDGGDGFETYKFKAPIRGNWDDAKTVYIVDEASLLSDVNSESDHLAWGSGQLLKDFLDYVGFAPTNDKKIVFVGDPAQLAPFGMDAPLALDAAYLRDVYDLETMEYQLREVVRQKSGSGIIRNANTFREGLEANRCDGFQWAFDDDVVRVAAADEVVTRYIADREREIGSIILTLSNDRASSLNRAVRSRLFPGREVVAEGDVLLVTAHPMNVGGLLSNGDFVRVVSVDPDVERRTVTFKQRNPGTGCSEVATVPLAFRRLRVVPSGAGAEAAVEVKVLDDLLHGTQPSLSSSEQRALFVDFLMRRPELRRKENKDLLAEALRADDCFNALRVKFGYAITCNKAQGGEWDHAYVHCDWIGTTRDAGYYRWIYTAITRASLNLFLVNPRDALLRGQDTGNCPEAGVDALPYPDPTPAVDAGQLQEAFQSGLLASVRDLLANTDIVIDDVAHHQYQEAFYLVRGLDRSRVNFTYNKALEVRKVAASGSAPFDHEVMTLLAPLGGRGNPASAVSSDASTSAEGRAFLAAYDDRIRPHLEALRVDVASTRDMKYSRRYAFQRGEEFLEVDVYFDKFCQLTNCTPLTGTAVVRARAGRLPEDILGILHSQMRS